MEDNEIRIPESVSSDQSAAPGPLPEWTPTAAPAPPFAPPQPGPPSAERRHSHAGLIAVAVLLSLVAGAAAGAGGAYVVVGSGQAGGASQKVELVSGTTDEVVAAVSAAALPSVVSIQSVTSGGTSGLPGTHPNVEAASEGSGVAYKSADGGGTYIITNNHVVDGATSITVTDSSGETHDATLVGGDNEYDVAVVRVAAAIPTIELGDSDNLVVGQQVVAIGSPFGLKLSVSSGVISALHRALSDFGTTDGGYPYMDSIQTDAAINPGNSGGALLDTKGRLIGIPSAIYSETGGSEGVALAIPVNRATDVADTLIAGGSVETPFLGVVGQSVTSDLVASEDLPVDEGAYVVEVSAASEAEKAGVKVGDVIVGVDDTRVRSMDDLILTVRRRSVGDTVTLTLWRDGKKITLDMTIGVKPAGQ